MIEVKGKNGISAKLIADSVSNSGKRMLTFEFEFHRWILAEMNTHRAISKNLQSSRAIPLLKAAELMESFPAYPVHWGKNQSGMQSKEELSGDEADQARILWEECIAGALLNAREFADLGAHKQWAARILEPYIITKGVFSGTDWDNLLWLRDDEDAQPEFKELAPCIQSCINQSTPKLLHAGEWHTPYVDSMRLASGVLIYVDADGNELSLDDAKKISASCCAQVSYRRLNDTKEKALEIFDKLFSGRKPHMSPTEHQGTPVTQQTVPWNPMTWQEGVTHVDRSGTLHSGNLSGWVQYRQTLPNNVYVKPPVSG